MRKRNMNVEKKINVLQIVEGFGRGGAELKLLELVKYMDRTKFNTTFCSLGLDEGLDDEFENIGVNSVTMKRKRRIDLGLLFKVVRLIREEKIDVVMTTLFYADVLGAIAGKLSGVKAIFSWETISSPEWLLHRRLLPYRFAVRFCNRVIAVSHATARFLWEKRGVPCNKIIVLPYGVDLKKYSVQKDYEMRKKLGLNGRDRIVGVVGRLEPQKGHIYLIHSAKKIINRFPDVKFVFAGEGYLQGELEIAIRENGLDKYFVLLGFRSDIPDVLKAFDIFTLPSLFEGLPNVVLEAMAAGKPVVASAVDGTVEAVVDDVTGFLVPPKNTEALQESLMKLLEDADLAEQMGLSGRKRVEEHFSLEKQVRRVEQLYLSSIVSNGKEMV